MRVLHLYSGNLYGGIEKMLVTLARARDATPQMQPTFALCFEGRLANELRDCGADVRMIGSVRFARPWTVWSARGRLRQLLRDGAFDVVVCHACWPYVLGAKVARAADVPVVFYAHDLPNPAHWLNRRTSKIRPAMAIANSEFTCRAIREHLFDRSTPTAVCYPPVEFPRVDSADDARREIRRELDCPADSVAILCASRLERWKGHATLIDALSQLDRNASWRCWIAGGVQRPEEASYLAELESQSRQLGVADRIRFLGQRADVPQLLAATDVYCQPNTSPEPFGVAFAEAVLAGVHVVTTDLGAAREIIRSTDRGTLVPAGDTKALVDALRSCIDRGPRHVSVGDPRALDDLGTDASMRKLAALLTDVVTSTPHAPR